MGVPLLSSLGDSFGEWRVINRQGAWAGDTWGGGLGGLPDTHCGCAESGIYRKPRWNWR